MKKITTDIKNHIILEETKISLKKYNKNISKDIVIDDEIISTWIGMGGAITESSAYNYSKLSEDAKERFIDAYYSKAGLDYNLGRVSIASCDFSLKTRSYAKKKDLRDFSIKKDYKYIIPLLNKIYESKKLSLVVSPWSPPKFMKTNKRFLWGGTLKKEYYDTYAKYLVNFIKEYENLGFNIDYLTIQNEPSAVQTWESCIFTPDEQKDFIYNHMINYIKDTNTRILLHDHNKDDIYDVVKKIYKKNKYIEGVGYHWYTGPYFENLKKLHDDYPELKLIETEMCCGFTKYDEIKWIEDAEEYAKEIIGNANNYMCGYLDWNILLDYKGGPNHKRNYCKSPIILTKNKKDFILTPIYYYLKHISNIRPNENILASINNTNLQVLSSSNSITILNTNDYDIDYNLIINKEYINDTIKSHSIITYTK